MRKFGHWTLDIGYWILFFVLLTACQSSSSNQPVLPDDKIARIMADLSIADAATTGLAGYAKDSLMHAYFNQVFEIHGVSKENYEKDLRILAENLVHMEEIVKMADELLTEGGNGKGEIPKK